MSSNAGGVRRPAGPVARPSTRPSVGNQALQRYLHTGAVRAKLQVGSTSDPAEREADRMADAALAGHPPAGRKPAGDAPPPNGRMHRELFQGHAGRPLGAAERAMFEPHFGDLGDVRLHDHPQAQASAAGLGARAFTAGRDIGFARGELTPQGAEGRRLLGHELAHVAQAGDVVRRSPDEELEEESEKPKAAPPYPVFTDDQIYAPLKASEDDDRQAEAAATEMRMLRSVVRQALEADVALTQRGTRDNRYARERLETFEETGYLPDRRVNMDGGAAGMNLAFSTGLPTTLKTAAIMAAFAALAFFFPPAAAALGGWIAGISIGEMLTGRSSGALNPLRLLEGDFQMGRELSLFERIVSGVTALLSILGVRASAAAAGPKIVSPVYRFAERDIVIVETSLGRQAFYRSTGENSGMAGKWLPFDEVIRAEIKTANGDIKVIEDWFNKLAYTEGVPKGTPLHRLGTEEFAAISEGLGKANLPMGEALATKEEVNAILDTFGARLNEYVMKRRPPP